MGRLAGGRSRPHVGEVVRGSAALLGIVALVAGAPAALWLAVGWPLPHAIPSLAELREGLSGSAIPEELFPRALAVVAWLAWAQFMVCLAVEARSALRGKVARGVPGAAWGVQRLASSLVAGALLLLPGEGLSAVALATPPHRPPAVVQLAAPPAPAPGTPAATDQPQAPATSGSRPTRPAKAAATPVSYEVRRRDTLWSIAERHLRDPLRWPEIFELNKGRRQPDGRELTQAHWIYPGWTLLLPSDAVGLPTRRSGTGAAPPEPAGPAGGGGGGAAGSTSGGGPAPAVPPPPSTAARPSTSDTPPTTVEPRGSSTGPDRSGGSGAAPATTTASQPRPASQPSANLLRNGGMLAAGILALLAVLRAAQQRRRRFGRRIAMPDPELAPVEAALRASEAPDVAERVDLGLRVMAAAVRRDGMESPEIMGVLVGPEMLEILLADESPAVPEPFVLSYSRRRWGLPVSIPVERLRQAAGSTAAPVPALVTLGTTEHGVLLLNLEAPGLTALAGNHDAARAVLASFAVELATCRWADFIELILVGFGGELRRLERARVAGSVKEVLPWLERKADDVVDLLGETQARSVLAGRVASDTPDAWVPAVVLCAERPSPEEVTRLVALTAVPSRSPVLAVIAAEGIGGARYTLRLPEAPGDPVHLPMFRLDVVPQRLDPQDYQGIAGLFETTTHDDLPTEEPARPREPLNLDGLRLSVGGELRDAEIDAEPDIEVRVLGRIEIGGIERVERGKSEELVVFLALHPDGVDGDQLAEALWPGRPPARGTLNTTTAVARAYLGMTPEGEPRLPQARNGIYRLHPSVGLDWVRFQALANRGYLGGEGGADDLRRALELVRGRPFEDAKPRSYGWAELDQAPVMESAIVDVADHLAELLLRNGDHAGAQWAARRGIATAPYEERLYRKLMLAADAAGDPAGADAVVDELLVRLEEENLEPYDNLQEETRALYERLTHRSRRAGAG